MDMSHEATTPRAMTKHRRPAVSNMGRCRNYAGKVSFGHLSKGDGRHHVNVSWTIDGVHKTRSYLVSRLVLAAFVGAPDDPRAVDAAHLDGVKTNNRLSNLAWQTHQENMQTERTNPNRSRAKEPTSKLVQHRRRGEEAWVTYTSASLLARALGYKNVGVISSIATGKRTHSQHEIRYVPQPDLDGEEWRRVPGIARIRVSNMGRIEYETGKRSYGARMNGYMCYIPNGGSYHSIHEMVMLAFVGPRPHGHEVDHINSVRDDNRLTNLQYLTRTANIKKAIIDHDAGAMTRGKPVIATKDGVDRPFRTASEASRETGLKVGSISYHAYHGGEHGGYAWRWEESGEHVAEEGEMWRELTDDILSIARRR